MRIPYAEVLDFFCWGLEVFSRRDCGLVLAGIRACESDRQAGLLLRRLERQSLIEREGRGARAKFRIASAGLQRLSAIEPEKEWNRSWDGIWRVFGYDIPETQRKSRKLLWSALRGRRFGLLQRSIWVWPHDVAEMLLQTVESRGIPECFCGFEASKLFLCDNAEVVRAAWDFDQIKLRHEEYLQKADMRTSALGAARDLATVARVAQQETVAHREAFDDDPMLPRALWPKEYRGATVQVTHAKFRRSLRDKLASVTLG